MSSVSSHENYNRIGRLFIKAKRELKILQKVPKEREPAWNGYRLFFALRLWGEYAGCKRVEDMSLLIENTLYSIWTGEITANQSILDALLDAMEVLQSYIKGLTLTGIPGQPPAHQKISPHIKLE